MKKGFEIDEKTQDILNKRMVLSLFKILFNQKKITRKEYENISNKLNRIISFN